MTKTLLRSKVLRYIYAGLVLLIAVGISHSRTDAAAGDLIITNLSQYQVLQRDGSDMADIPISGTFTAAPCSAVEASFNGGSYTTIDAAPGVGTFSGTLSAQLAGQGTLMVRCTDNITSTGQIDDFGIGDVFVIAGQSNAVGTGFSQNFFSHATLSATKYSATYGWEVGNDRGAFAGTTWPLVASHFMVDQNVPFAYITTAVGGSCLVCSPDAWNKTGDATNYNAMVTAVTTAAPGGVKAVLWLQGETDAINGTTSQAAYNTGLDTLAADIATDLPGAPPLVAGAIGQLGQFAQFPDTDNIRVAIQEAWGDNPSVLPGPITHDIGPLAGSIWLYVHFTSDEEMQTVADRWWSAIRDHFYGGSGDGRGPRLIDGFHTADQSKVVLNFTATSDLRAPVFDIGGIEVLDDGTPTSHSAAIVDSNTIEIELDTAVSGTLTVNIGSQSDADQDDFFTDSSEFQLPAETVVGYVTSVGNTESSIDSDGDGNSNDIDTDDDGDGINDTVEDSIAGGDANGDGILDSRQANVATVVNDVSSAHISLETAGCTTVSQYEVVAEASLSDDSDYSYPAGLNDFTIACSNPGDSATITVYYDQEYDVSDWTYRKYDGAAYTDITDKVTFATATVNSTTVTTASYTIVDGGSLDQDGVVNGVIVDPAGAALEEVLSNTGSTSVRAFAAGLFVAGSAFTLRRRSTLYRLHRDR